MIDFLLYCQKIWPSLQSGLFVILKLFAYTIIFSLPLGLIIALMNISKFPPIRIIASGYVWLFRGTPLLLQLFFMMYGLPYVPLIGVTFDRFTAAVVTFILNYGAYFSEIIRAGILSIDIGQHEAAKASGMTPFKIMQRIIIPQTVRRAIPPVANETITLIKDTALITSIGIVELLQAAKGAVNRDTVPTAFFVVAIMYLILTLILTYIFKMIEKRYSKYEVK